MGTGPGVFVATFSGTSWSTSRIADVSGNGAFNPALGETFVDTNGNGRFDAGETDRGPIRAFDIDQYLSVSSTTSGGEQDIRVGFLATNAAGNNTLFVSRVNRSEDSISTVAQVGQFLFSDDNDNGVADPDESALNGAVSKIVLGDSSSTGLGGSFAFHVETTSGQTAIVRATTTKPRVVVVATHGFNPHVALNPLNAFLASDGNEGWNDFRSNWYALGEKLEHLPAPTSPLENRILSYVTEWDSSTGWGMSYAHLAASAIFEAMGFSKGAQGALFISSMGIEKANRLAKSAAKDLVNDILSSGSYLYADPATSNAKQHLMLIGHSRGAAVNALAAREFQEKGYIVDEFISLDGHDNAWPGTAGALSDVNIQEVLAGFPQTRKVNYLVEDSLFDTPISNSLLLAAGLRMLGADTKPRVSESALSSLHESVLNAKAPARSGFENTTIFADTQVTRGPSNHVNITEKYLFSDTNTDPRGSKYLFDNFIGKNRCVDAFAGGCPAGISPNGETFPFSENSAAAGIGTAQTSDYGQVIDGDFERVGQAQDLLSGEECPPVDSPLLKEWCAATSTDAGLLSAALRIGDGLRIVREDGNTTLALEQTENSFLAQPLILSDQETNLEFDLTVDAAGRDDTLQFFFNGKLLGSVVLEDYLTLATLGTGSGVGSNSRLANHFSSH